MIQSGTIIPKNQSKQFLLLLGCIIFIIGCYYIVTNEIEGSRRYSPEFIQLIGRIGIVFFGLAGILVFYDILFKKPALIIDEKGILNNSHAGSGYNVAWKSIKEISIISVGRQRFIKIEVKNSEEIYSQVNLIKRLLLKLNATFYHSPVFITPILIKPNLDEVLKTIEEHHNRFKANKE